jgi:hypothetical protein
MKVRAGLSSIAAVLDLGASLVVFGGGKGVRTSSRQLIHLALVAMIAAACSPSGSGSTTAPSAAGASPSTVAASPSSPIASLVGRWKQEANVHTCDNYVRGMDAEGLLAAVESSPRYVPGESWQEVAKQFCKRSLEDWNVVHYHFFTAGGLFGSLNQDEQQVDNGTYKILDTHAFSIGRSKFHYAVRGDTLKMDPLITAAQRKEALAKPGKFTPAVWMVSVAVPGTSWHRVDCGSWC